MALATVNMDKIIKVKSASSYVYAVYDDWLWAYNSMYSVGI